MVSTGNWSQVTNAAGAEVKNHTANADTNDEIVDCSISRFYVAIGINGSRIDK